MNIITNEEFVFLSENRSQRLKHIAKIRHESDRNGDLTSGDLDNIIMACQIGGCSDDVEWLKNLSIMASNGSINRMKNGKAKWNEHLAQVNYLSAQKKIPYNIKEMIIIKDSGKKGTVVDYNIDTGEYVVLMTPYQVRTFTPDQLMSTWDSKSFTAIE